MMQKKQNYLVEENGKLLFDAHACLQDKKKKKAKK